MNNEIKVLTDREHILLRPAMYIGATDITTFEEFTLDDDKMVLKEISYVPALIKIINELIDNSVDVAIKSNFKSANVISVKMTKDTVEVQDNGSGIPVRKIGTGEYMPMIAWGSAKAGSNFVDENRTQIGMNGVGSFASNCFSKEFKGITDDGTHKYEIVFKNNAQEFKETIKKAGKNTGTTVTMMPDLERFGLTEIDKTHQNVILQRLVNLGLSFPEIRFSFNGKRVSINTFKKYVQMFSENYEIYETKDYQFAILPNAEDDFRQFSYVNGLRIPEGGTHIDIITRNIVDRIRDKLIRRYKGIKPADIRNKLMVVAFLKNLPNTKFNSQAKEKITNSVADINAFYNKEREIPYDTIVNKILKNPAIIDPITEIYKIKEEFKKRQDLKDLKKPKKIKSEKYFPSIKNKKYLLLVEGLSAFGGISPVLGREDFGYYVLRGVPLNVITATHSQFIGNKELSELFQIIKNEEYDYILGTTDADTDGDHIFGLLAGFIHKMLPEFKGKFGRIRTPVMVVSKNGLPVRWSYNIQDRLETKRGEVFNYLKGLGSFDVKELEEIVKVDGLEKMMRLYNFDSDKVLLDWLDKDSEPRKEYIQNNVFNINDI